MNFIVRFRESSIHIIVESAKHEKKVSMGFIVQILGEKGGVMERINLVKKISPTRSEMEVRNEFDTLIEIINSKFRYM